MTIALVQHTSNTALGASSLALAYGSNVGAGNLLVAQVLVASVTGGLAVSDSRGTWTSRPLVSVSGVAAGTFLQQFIAPHVSAGADTVTVTASGGGVGVISLNISEWSGAQQTAAFDSGNLTNDAVGTGTSAAPKSVSVTPSIAGCVVLGLEVNGVGNPASAGATGYAVLDNAPMTNFANFYQIQTTATATQSATVITSATWAALALILQPYTPRSRRTLTGIGTRTGSRQQVG